MQAWYNLWIAARPDAAGRRTASRRGWRSASRRSGRTSSPAAAERPDHVQGDRPVLRRRQLPAPRRSACPPARRTASRRRQHDDASRPAGRHLDPGRKRRRHARGRQRRRLLQAARRRRPGARQRPLGRGNQTGFSTLLPYDAAMANDGTVWAGLQDNGEHEDRPRRASSTRRTAATALRRGRPRQQRRRLRGVHVYGDMSATTDGGKTWRSMGPAFTSARFINPASRCGWPDSNCRRSCSSRCSAQRRQRKQVRDHRRSVRRMSNTRRLPLR